MIQNHIVTLKGKVEAAYQKSIALSTNPTLKWVEMETLWISVEVCVVPLITYAGETFNIRNKKEKEDINRLLENIVKRILMVPRGTPREALYVETGLMQPTTVIERQRINMLVRLRRKGNEWMKAVTRMDRNKGWMKQTAQIMEDLRIKEEDIHDGSIDMVKSEVEKRVKERFKSEIEKARQEEQGKTKTKYLLENKQNWEPGKCPQYMKAMNRGEASLIFKARCRMLEFKCNYKNKYKGDLSCRKCHKEEETQEHALQECEVTHRSDDSKVTTQQIFTEDITELKETGSKIRNILKEFEVQALGASNAQRPP